MNILNYSHNEYLIKMPEKLKFEKNRTKFAQHCPCGKSNKDGKFSPFKGYSDKGKCFSCDEIFLPGFQKSNIHDYSHNEYPVKPNQEYSENSMTSSTINESIFKKSTYHFKKNNFFRFLMNLFGEEKASELCEMYYVGSATKSRTVFWQVDYHGSVRSGKVMSYSAETGKRNKSRNAFPTWVHSELKLQNFELRQCLFGEHLLKQSRKKVGIVESEKTAIICAGMKTDRVWLATGGKTGLSPFKFKNLKESNVKLFPDLGEYDFWSTKSDNLGISNISVSSYLEERAPNEDRSNGFDLADYFIQAILDEREIESKKQSLLNNPLINLMISTFDIDRSRIEFRAM